MTHQPRPATTQVLYGLAVASQLPLHVDRPFGTAVPDVTVTLEGRRKIPDDTPEGSLLAEFASRHRRLYSIVTTPTGEHVLRFHRAVEFVVSPDLSSVRTYLAPDQDDDIAAVLISGTLMSFQLAMRGLPLLHGSAVDLGSRAMAFVGASGMGKSTMATMMCSTGARLITDDVLRLDLAGRLPRCHLGATETRLRKAASELTEAFTNKPAGRRTGDDRDALQLAASDSDLLELAAIVVPQPRRDRKTLELTRLRASEALLELSRYPRIVGWVESGTMAQQFEYLARTVRDVPVYLADVPWGPPFSPDIPSQLLDAAGLVLDEQAQRDAVGST